MIDTDCDGEKIFITKVLPRLKPELKEKIKRITHTKSPRGSHFLGKTKGGNDKIEKKEHTWKLVNSDGKGHDEIKIRLYGFYSIECGNGYDEVTAIEKSETFTFEEIDEIVRVTNDAAKQCNAIKTITDKIKPYYIKGNRDEINFSLSGLLHRGHVPEQLILDIVDPLIDRTSSVEPKRP